MINAVKFADYQTEIVAMMSDMLHLEPQPVDIPIARYMTLANLGVLQSFLWLDGETIKGVALLFVSPSLRNDAVIVAQTDVIWVKPVYRGNSRLFIDGIKGLLQQKGIDYWYISSRDSVPIDNFLLKNDFCPLERVYFCQLTSGEVKNGLCK